jgi:hypothetical protein
MKTSLVRGGAALLAILISIPAIAQTTPPASSPPAQKPLDPNQVICEKQEVVGSRLATRRVCHTRAQWADLKLEDRQAIDKMQTNRGFKGE